MVVGARTRVWRPVWPCPAGQILGQHRRGAGDPTFRVDGNQVWRGLRTPDGPVTLLVTVRSMSGEVQGEAWGPGAEWTLDRLPALLGAEDDVRDFRPQHPVLIAAHRRFRHWRFSRSGSVLEALVPSIIEQKVTGQEAFAGFRALVTRFGEPAPDSGRDVRLWVQPGPEALRAIPSWEWLRLPVDPARSKAVLTAARVAGSLEALAGLDAEEMHRRLTSLPGIGVWTSAEVRQRVLGDADAVSFGDFHVAADIGWALERRAFDDDELAAYLEPWRPHRARVQALIALAGLSRPRHGPRMAPRTHLPARRPGGRTVNWRST